MNHQDIYNKIINKAKLENRFKVHKNKNNNYYFVYYENHHIIPKCLDGTDNKENLVLLTAKEHYICHKLLTYIYPKNRKITCAFHIMTFNNKIRMSSRDYVYARELISKIPISDESKRNNRLNHIGKKHSEETINKIKIKRSHQSPPLLGKTQSKEHIEKRVSQFRNKQYDKINDLIKTNNYSVKELAKMFNISIHTIYKYKKLINNS